VICVLIVGTIRKKNKIMKIRGYILVITILLVFSVNSSIAQFIQFSQYYSAPLTLGPSFAGMTKGSRIALNYRDQWPNVPGTFVTYGVSYDHYFAKMNSGLGFLMLRDRAGSGNLALTSLAAQYSYNIPISSDWFIRPGVAFKYAQRSIDFDKLIFGDQLNLDGDPLSTSIENRPDKNVGYIDATFSTLMFSNKFWIGGTVDHLLRPNQSLVGGMDRLPMRIFLYGGGRFYLEKNYVKRRKNDASVSVSFLYKMQEGYNQLDLGVYWKKYGLTLGTWYRGMPVFTDSGKAITNVDAVVFLVGYKWETLSIGYSYDFTISELINNTGGSHEISLIYEFNQSIKIVERRRKAAVPCPMFD